MRNFVKERLVEGEKSMFELITLFVQFLKSPESEGYRNYVV